MAIENMQLEIKDTLERSGFITVVAVSSRHGDLRFLFRVSDETKWFDVLSQFLAEEGSWYSFIGKKYFMHQGKVMYGWTMMFESDELEKAVSDIRALLSRIIDGVNEKPDEPESWEVPLPGGASGYREIQQRRVRSVR